MLNTQDAKRFKLNHPVIHLMHPCAWRVCGANTQKQLNYQFLRLLPRFRRVRYEGQSDFLPYLAKFYTKCHNNACLLIRLHYWRAVITLILSSHLLLTDASLRALSMLAKRRALVCASPSVGTLTGVGVSVVELWMDINGECNTLLSVTGFFCHLITAAEDWVSLFSAGCAFIERLTVFSFWIHGPK